MTFIKVFFSLGMIFAAIYLSILDIKTQKIPRLYSYIFVGFSILGGFFVTRSPLSTIIAGFLGFGLFFLVRKITKNKLGLADCFFSSGIGFFFGFEVWLRICFTACIVGTIMFIRFEIIKHSFKGHVTYGDYAEKMKAFIPFIPCLTFGVIVYSIIWMV